MPTNIEIKARVYEVKHLGRDSAELTARTSAKPPSKGSTPLPAMDTTAAGRRENGESVDHGDPTAPR